MLINKIDSKTKTGYNCEVSCPQQLVNILYVKWLKTHRAD